MSRRRKVLNGEAMLDLWRPPPGAGDPVGCLTTTYTFSPGLFDEHCLARFLEIESDPNREDLAFLLERESRLGSVYAGVLVDHTQAGKEHSLRWDILPVRIRHGKQHAKISLLSWTGHVRIIVASANLTEPGYRGNREVAVAVNLTPQEADIDAADDAVDFLRALISLVPGASEPVPEARRAREFLDGVSRQVKDWKPSRRRGTVRQQLLFTLPSTGEGRAARSALEESVLACRRRGSSPNEARIASPFFDAGRDAGQVTASLCKLMARGERRKLTFCVPAVREDGVTRPRLAAPVELLQTPRAYQGKVSVRILPDKEGEHARLWHAKMLGLISEDCSALMIGSSNFTCAGMGVGEHRNAEANLITIADRVEHGREVGKLDGVWPETELILEPESADWLGARPDKDEEEQAKAPPLPAGFISATYRAGSQPQIALRFDPGLLPEEWSISEPGHEGGELLSASGWRAGGSLSMFPVAWTRAHAPDRLVVSWGGENASLPVNVEDRRDLPPPAQLEHMSADDMLLILAESDPSAAFRAWAVQREPVQPFDSDLDSATPIDLDPLRRYDLEQTFLHRVRRRARILAQLREKLQSPVWGHQALEWRLRGIVGVEPLADRLVQEFVRADCAADEALLTLADLLILLQEVDYKPGSGSLPKEEFDESFRLFLRDLADKIQPLVGAHRDRVSEDMMQFWERVVERCQV